MRSEGSGFGFRGSGFGFEGSDPRPETRQTRDPTAPTAPTPSRAWVAAKGARRFALAIAMGDVADDATVAARRGVCRECPSRVRVAALGAIGVSDWCGEPFVERLDGPVEDRTCGCLLAGKTSVGSERCPRGKW